MVDIGNLVRAADNLTLQRLRPGFPCVAHNTHAHLIGKIQALPVLFQHVHHPQALLIVVEGLAHALGQRRFSCVAFRRLMHKTQVFLQPEGDHYRTRMTHTLEVSRIAGTITRALGLNEDLSEAIAMGHDLGHTPFGHAGEAALSQCMGKPFHHNEQSLRVVDVLEKDGQGLCIKKLR